MVQKIASPFGGYYIYPDDPENLFQQMLGTKPATQQETSRELTPAVDIYEDDSAFYASVEMPGVVKDNLKLSCTEGRLTINADVDRSAHNAENGHWVQHERRVGTYLRSIQFRAQIREDAITASLDNGILELKVPKKTKEKKTISINVD